MSSSKANLEPGSSQAALRGTAPWRAQPHYVPQEAQNFSSRPPRSQWLNQSPVVGEGSGGAPRACHLGGSHHSPGWQHGRGTEQARLRLNSALPALTESFILNDRTAQVYSPGTEQVIGRKFKVGLGSIQNKCFGEKGTMLVVRNTVKHGVTEKSY